MSYAAGMSSAVSDENVSYCILTGHFQEEIALIGDAVAAKNSSYFVASSDIVGQAVATPTLGENMIGEEVFAVNAYLGKAEHRMKKLLVLDLIRAVLVVILVIAAILNILGAMI